MTKQRFFALAVSALLVLTGCGSDTDSADLTAPLKGIASVLTPAGLRAPSLIGLNPAAALALRAKLEAEGKPTYLVSSPAQRFQGLMTPYGQNRDVTTWVAASGETISLRDSLLVATGGFGPDLMSSSGPSLDRLRNGVGATTHSFHYLDGGDQPKSFDFACTLLKRGPETITVMGKPYVTRPVLESCSHPLGSFVNIYWFDTRLILRQSRQVLTLGLESLTLQRIID